MWFSSSCGWQLFTKREGGIVHVCVCVCVCVCIWYHGLAKVVRCASLLCVGHDSTIQWSILPGRTHNHHDPGTSTSQKKQQPHNATAAVQLASAVCRVCTWWGLPSNAVLSFYVFRPCCLQWHRVLAVDVHGDIARGVQDAARVWLWAVSHEPCRVPAG